jgi:hypothetical protein
MNQNDSAPELLRRQRDDALACMFLSLIMAISLLSSMFIPNRSYFEANSEIARHEKLLAENESVLKANKLELAQDLILLEKARRDAKTRH